MKKKFMSFFGLLKTAATGMANDKVPTMGAAIAYYTAFSIAPLLVITLAVVGLVVGKGGSKEIFDTIGGMVGENGAKAIQGMVKGAAQQPHASMIATMIGIITLIAGASGIFTQLQESLNMIWKVAKKPSAGIWSTLQQRLLSFGMVGVIAFLLLVSLLASAGLSAAGRVLGGSLPGSAFLWQLLDFAISIGVTSLLFALIFKVLPDVKLSWRDGLIGGLFTAVLFTIGKFAIGAYLGHSSVASSYGAAGSLIVVLLWVFYTSQLVLFGAEFTQAYATRGGRPVLPTHDAAITITAFTAAAIGEKAVEGKSTHVLSATSGTASSPAAEGGSAMWYGSSAVAAALGGLLLKNGQSAEDNRMVASYVGGGLLLGAAAAILAMLEISKRLNADEDEENEGPSMASKIVSKIPTKVKVATVVGALKGGGGEAAREVSQKVKHMVGVNDR